MHQSSFSGQSQLKVNTCTACTLVKNGALTWLSGLCVPMTLLRAIRTGKGQRVGSTQTSVSRSSKHGGLGLRPTTSFRKRNIFVETAKKRTEFLYEGLPGSSKRMTASSESRMETSGMKLEVLNAKRKTRLGSKNLQTMYETGRPGSCSSSRKI